MVDQSDNLMDWENNNNFHVEANFDQSDNDADNVTDWESNEDMNEEEDLCMSWGWWGNEWGELWHDGFEEEDEDEGTLIEENFN